MNEVKKARQQLDARNGIQPAKTRKAPKKRPKKKRAKTENASARCVQEPKRETNSGTHRGKPVQNRQRSAGTGKKASPLDERQRAQQAVTARRRKKRKKNYILYYIILFLFIIVAGIILSLTVFFNIETIDVEGTSKYTAEEIVAKSGLQTGDNLFRISTGDASKRIISELEYIDNVEIRRSFPNKLTITVTEAKPVMSLSSGTNYYLVSDAGRILESGLSGPKENTFVVTGIDLNGYKNGDFISTDTSPEMETLHTINDICAEMDFTGLTRIDLNSIVDIRIYVNDRIRIDIGSVTDLKYKLTFAREIIDGQLDKEEKGIVDVKQAGTAYFRPSDELSDSSSSAPDSSQSASSASASQPDSSHNATS